MSKSRASAPSSEIPLSRTKVVLPRRRDELLTRPRLLDLLNKFLDKKLILITAPAGYGKTSLLADLSSQSELPVCWLALDELDRDPQRFAAYFIAALSERFPSFGAQSASALKTLTSLEQGMEALVVTLTNELYDQIREHFILVLDDYHLVEGVAAIRDFLGRFLKLTDENCHLVVSSRRLTPLPDLPRMVAREQVEGLDFAELAFRPEEIQALLAQNYRMNISGETARDLAEKSEGWITGLQLADFSNGIPERARVARAANVDLSDYFDEQVFAPQPALIREALLYTSLFDEFNADLCRSALAELFPEPLDWDGVMTSILANNLFVLPVGDGSWFRYHHLFRDFLQGRLNAEKPDRVQFIRARLVKAYEERGEWERAYSICAQLNDPELLAELIERAGSVMVRRAVITLDNWLTALPAELIHARPGLLSLRGGIGYLRGNFREALALQDRAVAIYRERGEPVGLALALTRRATAHRNLADYKASLQDAEDVLQLSKNAPGLQTEYAEAQRAKGLALSRLGRTREAIACYERSLEIYEGLRALENIPIVLLSCGIAYRACGNYEAAERSFLKALELWGREGDLTWQSGLLQNLGILYHILGEYEKASRYLQEGLACANRSHYQQQQVFILASLGELYAELEEYEGALQSFLQAETLAKEIGERYMLTYLALAKSAQALTQGETDVAERLLMEALPVINANNSHLELGLWSLQRGRLALVKGEAHTAIETLASAERSFTEADRDLETMWSRVWLMAALSSAGEAGVAEILKDLTSVRGPASHALAVTFRQARPWLGRLKSDPILGRAAGPLFHRADQFGTRLPGLRRNLRRLPQAVALSAPRLVIQSLGWTKVTVNGRAAEWPTQSVRELFFYFLASQKPVNKEQVAETLWADTEDPERLKQRFKNELYRLRRAVGTETILLEGELYRFNRALDYDCDLDDFESHLARAKSAETDEARIEAYEKAVGLVKGPYLADIGATWAVYDRERLRQAFLDAALRLAKLHWDRNDPGKTLEACQRALEIDSANEPAHQMAMRAHAARNDRAAIVRQYQACREALAHLFDLPPSEETEALYRRLIA